MALDTARLVPPLAAPATDAASGRTTEAWNDFFEQTATQLANLRASVAANVGVTDGSDAAAGSVGEYLTATASVSIGSGAATDVVTLPLTAGDWDVSGAVVFSPSGNPSHLAAGISSTAGTIGTNKTDLSLSFAPGSQQAFGAGMVQRMNSVGAQTAHLVAFSAHTGTMSVAGTIVARRPR